jgi:hypothetical protein
MRSFAVCRRYSPLATPQLSKLDRGGDGGRGGFVGVGEVCRAPVTLGSSFISEWTVRDEARGARKQRGARVRRRTGGQHTTTSAVAARVGRRACGYRYTRGFHQTVQPGWQGLRSSGGGGKWRWRVARSGHDR